MFTKCKIACDLNLQSYIKNPNYLEIFLAHKDDKESACQALHQEMVRNGTIGKNKTSAISHYQNQYYQYCKKA
ncbi:MAG: hypothetical protein PVI40_02750 [Chlamydiota bacterium]|jgi:hypothetical protein